MNKPAYYLQYDELKLKTVKELREFLDTIPGIPLSDLRLKDLVMIGDEFLEHTEGVYIFKEDKDYAYVGKCSSMSFIERIGKHLDYRHNAWFNTLVKTISHKKLGKLIDKNNRTEEGDQKLKESVTYSFNHLHLMLIGFSHNDRNAIANFETLLRYQLIPYNKINRNIKYNVEDRVEFYMR